MAKRLAELGALQDAVSNDEAAPSRLGLAGYIRGLFLDWSANPYNPLTRLSARGRLLGYFWDSGAIGLSMNFADQNFLVKEGTVKSKSFSDIVNFSRTTNATVTNSAGLITYAPHNLLTFSEQFDNAYWTKQRATINSNIIVAPNGIRTADKLTEDTQTGNHTAFVSINVTSGLAYTFSVYIKAAERGFAQVRYSNAGSTEFYAINVNLSDGTFAAVSFGSPTGTLSSVTSVGDGWYRCAITSNTTNTTFTAQVFSQLVQGANSYTGDNTSGIYLWGAQLEIGSTATTYNPTTVKNLLGFSELFDNAAWTKSNSFVQTNLVTYSEALDNAAWTKTNCSVTANAIVAPNGTTTADLITPSTTAGNCFQQISSLAANTYTLSLYIKAGTATSITIGIVNIADLVVFNPQTGLVTGGLAASDTTVTSVGDGWYRLQVFRACTAGNFGPSIKTTTASGTVYVWGIQFVSGSVAGDYRRTDAAALPVYYPNHNGVVVAEQIQGTAANGTVLESYTATGGSMTFSIWIRRITGTGNVDITMDTGVTWTTQAITTSWARYSITTTPTAGARTAGVRLVTSGDVIQVFGAQLSDSASLDPYVLNAAAAPTAAAFYGARFDYDPVTLAPKGLLIEEQRSNLLLNSAIAGTNLATQNVTVTAVAHTLSFYGTGNIVLSGTASATLTGTGAYPTRSTLTFTPTAGTLTLTVTGTVQYAQLEIGSFATSFIPTGASQVTRAADIATIQGSNFYSWYNQNEGSFFASMDYMTASNGAWVLVAHSGSAATTNDYFAFFKSSGTSHRQTITASGIFQGNLDFVGALANTYYKYAGCYKVNDAAFTVDGANVLTDNTVNLPMPSTLQIGNLFNQYQNGHIKQISYYPQRLSNDVLKGLTA